MMNLKLFCCSACFAMIVVWIFDELVPDPAPLWRSLAAGSYPDYRHRCQVLDYIAVRPALFK